MRAMPRDVHARACVGSAARLRPCPLPKLRVARASPLQSVATLCSGASQSVAAQSPHSAATLYNYLDNRNQRYYFKAITSMKISSLLRNVSCIDLREENSTPTAGKGLESGAGPRLHYGKFLISKLKKTQGLTFANTLRRILLYEVPTTGITSVKFQTKYIGEYKESSPSSEPSEEQGWRNFGSEAPNTGPATRRWQGAAMQEGEGKVTPSPRERSYAAGFAERSYAEQQFRSQIIHEFSRIPGIYESLLEFTMNLESVVLKKNSEYSVIGNVGVSRGLGSGPGFASAEQEGQDKVTPSPRYTNACVQASQSVATSPQYATITLILPALVGSASQSVATQSQHEDSITLPTQVAISHIIRAKDLILPSGFSVVYPDQYIATLMGGQIRRSIIEVPETSASLLIVTCSLESHFECLETDLIRGQSSEATVYADVPTGAASQEGRDKVTPSPRADFTEHSAGFASTKSPVPSETPLQLNKKSAPVKKVNYTIENAGEPNQGEQVIFEIWTNGAISPQDAFAYGIQYAVKLFQQFLPEVR